MYLLFKTLKALVQALPPRFTYVIGAVLAESFYLFARRNRQNLQANILHVMKYQGKDINSISHKIRMRKLARKNFRNFAYYLIDFFRFSRFEKSHIKALVAMEGLENIDLMLAPGRGGIGVTAHIGNWELGAIVLGLLGYPVNAVALSHENTKLNNLFVQQRALGGVTVLPVGRSAQGSLKALRSGELLLIVGDRDVTERGEMMEFFGRPTMIPRGPGAFSARTGAGILFGCLVREGTHQYRFVLNPPIKVDPAFPEPEREDQINRELVRQMEKAISSHLDQWFVYYRLWPEDEFVG